MVQLDQRLQSEGGLLAPEAGGNAPHRFRTRIPLFAGTTIALGVVLAIVFTTAQSGVATNARLRNPASPTAAALHPLWNVHDWPTIFSFVFVVVAAGLLSVFGWLSVRQHHVHHGLIVLAAVTLLSWMDPIANWVTFTVFNPSFLHFPTSWAWISLAPLVEPVTNVPGYPMYFLSVGLVAYALAKFMLARSSSEGWLRRHPLLTIFGVGFVVAFIWDVFTELFMLRAGMYLYSQSYGPIIHWGPAEYPVIWGFFTWSSIAMVTVLLYRDADDQSVLSRLGRRLSLRRHSTGTPSALRQIAAGVIILSLTYSVSLGLYGGLRLAHLTHKGYSGQWPYPSTKVYDPQGVLEHAGVTGPFYQ
jgi:Spirocyclase AveC-like